ncbi:mono/diheme cytochrome c family protein [Hoeflea halophila]|uniref:Mono/diheme cytochrome c family protein n=1 Tax=Hoeflea halophila TaxID=714899 RepID=A0A286IAW9_9HYPH|nr:cytochrome c [Hoeflea halophila]SOE17157.1 mono/diheme cytochrome c family protein [Hoeflea halophila]
MMRFLIAPLLLVFALPSLAQEDNSQVDAGRRDLGSTTEKFTDEDGAELYRRACSGCHGPEGKGAYGAGRYPALADNPRLGHARFPVNLILEGNGAMPSFADWLDDAQVAAIVSFLQTNLGNDYDADVSAEDVKRMRAKFADLKEG